MRIEKRGIPCLPAGNPASQLFCICPAVPVPVKQQVLKVRGRAQAPVVAFHVRPAFAFEMYASPGGKRPKRTGQLRKGLNPFPFLS